MFRRCPLASLQGTPEPPLQRRRCRRETGTLPTCRQCVFVVAALAAAQPGRVADAALAKVFFEEQFSSNEWESRWVHSKWKGSNGPTGRFEWSAGQWQANESQKGLRAASDMHYHGISAKLPVSFSNRGRDLVVQYSVKHESEELSFCGGGYMKLLGSDIDQENFGGDTPYRIMFGPDICGYDISRVHLILNWNGENLLRKPDINLEYDDRNEFTHLYTLVVRPDNSYNVYVNLKEKSSGNLHDSWDFPNKTMDDPEDKKPADWVEVRRIVDTAAQKPKKWVDKKRVPDSAARKPDEWDDEEDGEYQPPMVDNPSYKGEWFPPRIDNPEYRGQWRPRQFGNPAYREEVYSYADIGAVGFELWTVNKGSIFDNILLCDSWEHAKAEGEKLLTIFEKEKEAKRRWEANGKKASAAAEEKSSEEQQPEDSSGAEEGDTIHVDGPKPSSEL